MNKIGIFIGLMFFLGYSASAGAGEEIEARLDGAYEGLYVSLYGLQYPPNRNVLDACFKNNDRSCINAYERVQEAKKTLREIIDRDESFALANTLNKIFVHCGGNAGDSDFSCIGAVIALYFFNEERHQQPIMDALSKSGGDVISLVFGHHYPWFFNRPDPDRWIVFVNSLPDRLLPPMGKRITIQYFEDSKQNFERFGVML